MGAKDNFFNKVKEHKMAEEKLINAFNSDLEEFQRKTEELINQISSWFEGLSIEISPSQTAVDIDEFIRKKGTVSYVKSLTLTNGRKKLKITPEKLCCFNKIIGSLRVNVYNPNRSPSDTFFLNMRDSRADEYDGWVISRGDDQSEHVYIFNEENFFRMVESFA